MRNQETLILGLRYRLALVRAGARTRASEESGNTRPWPEEYRLALGRAGAS